MQSVFGLSKSPDYNSYFAGQNELDVEEEEKADKPQAQ